MIFEHIEHQQGTDEWFNARIGKWTASCFAKLITKTGKASTQALAHNDKLVTQKVLGRIPDTFKSEAMERGNEMEPEALDFVNFARGTNFEPVGFFDSGKGYGCSPDAIDWERKLGVEIKCPLEHTHARYLLNNKVPDKYYAQVQGSLLVSGFENWVFCSYHPELKPLMLLVKRDEDFIKSLKGLLDKNCRIVSEDTKKLKEILQ